MFNKSSLIAITLLASLSTPVFAQGSLQHSAASVGHSAQASGQVVVGGAQLVSGVASVPLAASAGMGKASGNMAGSLRDTAQRPIGEPLPISDEIITVSPDRAISE